MRARWFRRGVGFLVVAVAVVFIIGLVIMLLWNALVPDLFRGPSITYWQAVGLLVLSHLLLRGGPWHRRHGWHHEQWRRRLEERMAGMTPEEREKFKAGFRSHCGFSADPEETKAPGTTQ